MTTASRSIAFPLMLPIAALSAGVLSVLSWLIGGVPGMVLSGAAGIAAIALGTVELARQSNERGDRAIAAWGVGLGTLGLAGQWATHVILAIGGM